jgi:hypothetical protein
MLNQDTVYRKAVALIRVKVCVAKQSPFSYQLSQLSVQFHTYLSHTPYTCPHCHGNMHMHGLLGLSPAPIQYTLTSTGLSTEATAYSTRRKVGSSALGSTAHHSMASSSSSSIGSMGLCPRSACLRKLNCASYTRPPWSPCWLTPACCAPAAKPAASDAAAEVEDECERRRMNSLRCASCPPLGSPSRRLLPFCAL